MTGAVRILDCTLRDGSYVVDFQFTPDDVIVLIQGLEAAGVDLIEIGHGLGLGASAAGKGAAAASDEEYLDAAAGTLGRAAWGMFLIPGIGQLTDVDLAARYRMPFIRIGCNARDVEETRPFIDRAKSLGMTVSLNLMKSYGLSPGELAAQAASISRSACDVITLVDSAGTMLPSDVREYTRALRDSVGVQIGFHGHDNLRLAIANTLAAVDSGAAIVDSTLQGIGRSGGNAASEILAAVLKRQNVVAGIDLYRLMDLSDRVVRPMLRSKGVDPIDLTAGLAGFHSSYLTTILQYAARYDVDVRDVIEGVCEVDRFAAPPALVDQVARQLAEHRPPPRRDGGPPRLSRAQVVPADTGERTFHTTLAKVAATLRTRARKAGLPSVLNVVAAATAIEEPVASAFVQEQFGFVIGSAEVGRAAHVDAVVDCVDGIVDALLVDSEMKPYLDQPLGSGRRPRVTSLYSYKDSDVWVRAVVQQIDAIGPSAEQDRIVVCGTGSSALKCALAIAERGFHVTLTGESSETLARGTDTIRAMALGSVILAAEPDTAMAARSARLFVVFTDRLGIVDQRVVQALAPDAVVFVARVGSMRPDAIEEGINRGVRFVRPDMRAALAAELHALIGARRLVTEMMGRSEIAGVPVVAGGCVGRRGDVVVDSIARPLQVVGIADGCGTVIYEGFGEFAERVSMVQAAVWRNRFV